MSLTIRVLFGLFISCLSVVAHVLSCIWLLCDPKDCSSPGSLVCGIVQARIMEWVAISYSRRFSISVQNTEFLCWGSRLSYLHLTFLNTRYSYHTWSNSDGQGCSTAQGPLLAILWIGCQSWTQWSKGSQEHESLVSVYYPEFNC